LSHVNNLKFKVLAHFKPTWSVLLYNNHYREFVVKLSRHRSLMTLASHVVAREGMIKVREGSNIAPIFLSKFLAVGILCDLIHFLSEFSQHCSPM